MTEGKIQLGKGQSLDDALLDGAVLGLSPEQISDRIGGVLTPARVAIKLRELLSASNWLEDAERERAVLHLLERKLVELNKFNDLDTAKLVLAYGKELLVNLNKRKAVVEDQLLTYDRNVGQQLGHVVDLALGYMQGALREKVDPETWDRTKQEALALAWREIQSKQVEG